MIAAVISAPAQAATTTSEGRAPSPAPAPQAADIDFPTPNGEQAVDSTIEVTGTFDGELTRYYGAGDLGGGGQDEGQPAMFVLEDGATLKNVVIGAPAADGVHCLGSCTISNVWWENVGEDAATSDASSSDAVMTISGGAARQAEDKVFQHNGPGTVRVEDFAVSDFGKLYRSCGNCSEPHQRNVVLNNVSVYAPGNALVGINTNYGDTARLSGITVHGDSEREITICSKYRGVTDGEPEHIGSGPDDTHCLYTSEDITYN